MSDLNEWIDPEFPNSLTIAEMQNLKDGLMKEVWGDEGKCPSCGSSRIIRKGHTSSGSQRYVCKKCCDAFVTGHPVAFPYSHIDKSVWGVFLTAFLGGGTLRVCSRKCNVCLKTSFLMKRRIIDSIRKSEGYPGVLFHGEAVIDGCELSK